MCQFFAELFPRKDRDAHLGEVRVAARVVDMHVGIDHKTNRRGADLSDRRHDLVGELCVLGIDHEDAVRAGQHADPATGSVLMARVETRRTGQHIEVRRDLLCRDVNFAVVRAPAPRRSRKGPLQLIPPEEIASLISLALLLF